jgi:hypothetical protein
MPSLNDFFTELQQVNANLQQLHNDSLAETAATNSVRASVDQVNATLIAGFTSVSQGLQVIANLQHLTNRFLFHKIKQEDTIICILEKVSKNTCELVNEATVQTRLQSEIRDADDELRLLFETVNASAALEFQRLKKVQADLEACCPPEIPPPACVYEPCPSPPRTPGEPSRGEIPQFAVEASTGTT